MSINARFQCQIFDEMMTSGIVLPYAPLVTHFQHSIFPRHEQDWIDYELAILPRFDAGVRLNVTFDRPGFHYEQSESPGADVEETELTRLGIPIFHSVHELYRWVQGDWNG